MIVTQIQGGLGNQMLIYAAGFSLAKDLKEKHKMDLSHYSTLNPNETKRTFELSLFNTTSEIANDIEISKTKSDFKIINELNRTLMAYAYLNYPLQKYFGVTNLYLDGHYNSEKFFKRYRNEILEEFTLRKDLQTREYLEIAKEMNQSQASVSIHIRRGDYITNKNANKWHGVLDQEYYKNALNLVNQSNKNCCIYVFSDEIDWVKQNFKFLPRNSYFVSKHKFNSAQEMTLMSNCKHNIIANSSFSWWGAWLNKNENKTVIAPSKWIVNKFARSSDIVPKEWYRI